MDVQQLPRAVEVVARPADHPGKRDLIREGLEELDNPHYQGHVAAEEHSRLRAVLFASPEHSRALAGADR